MNKTILSNKVHAFQKQYKKILLTLILFAFIIALVISPKKYIDVTLDGIRVWATAILPALFPFMIFTRLLASMGCIEDFSKGFSGVSNKLYRTPGISSYVFLMSIISGYPLGAKVTSDLYERGLLSRAEAHRICSFTSNSGPMFIIGTVGIGMLISPTAGYIILISHILAAIINGLIYRKYNAPELSSKTIIQPKKNRETDILTNTMENGINSVLLIGGYIAIFFVITEILYSLGIFSPLVNLFSKIGIEKSVSNGIIFGFFEITKGCLLISSAPISLTLKTIICSLIISFGGLAVSFQAFAFLNKFKISKKFFFLQKTTHALLSTGITMLLILIFFN